MSEPQNHRHMMAVDLGASGGKCYLGTLKGGAFSVKELARFPYEGVSLYLPENGGKPMEHSYWDDIFIYGNIVKSLHTFRRETGAELSSVGIDTWGADGQCIDRHGELIGNVYCYRDHRLDNMIDRLKTKIDPRRVYEITGIHFQPFNQSNQLLWLAENRPENLSRAVRFLPIPTLFYYYLGGAAKVDSSWASITQLMDARTRKWSTEIFDAIGVPMGIMPEIVSPGTVIGSMHEDLAGGIGIKRPKLIAVGSHDTASAFAAAPVRNTHEALIISSGTWSLIGKLIPEPITSDAAFGGNMSNEGGIGDIRFLKNCMGTWIVQELRRAWEKEDGKVPDWSEVTALAEKAPAFKAFIDPDDPSFYNPRNMADAMADFFKKTNQPIAPAGAPGRGSFVRAVYESLALKYRQINELICRASGTSTKVVHIVGGGSKNTMLNQFVSESLGLPVLAGPDEATAAGNLMVQAMGAGIIGSMREAIPLIKEAFTIEAFTPRQTAEWDKQYGRFIKLIFP